MKSKTIFLILFFIILLIPKDVFADNVSCPYANIDNETDTIEAIINIDGDKNIVSFSYETSDGLMTVRYGNHMNNYFLGDQMGIYPFGEENDYEDNAVKFIELNKGMCPPYFYIKYDISLEFVGFFSDKNKENIKTAYDYAFKSIAQENKKDENNNFVPTDERYSCTLNSPLYNDFSLSVEINYTTKKINFSNNLSYDYDLKEYEKNFDFTQKNKCPDDLKACYNSIESVMSELTTYYIFPRKIKTFENRFGTNAKCFDLIEYKENENGTKSCNVFTDYINAANNYYSEKNFSLYSSSINKLKIFCNNILQHQDYDPYEYSCSNLCLNVSDYIHSIGNNDSKCGLSEKLILYIANIVKWIKYIIPVIVIVLGILDFIQAIAADKDDGMKKAQGRFVKRLIAAALIFIIPFIIEFVLDKMGFGSNGCGIIDL